MVTRGRALTADALASIRPARFNKKAARSTQTGGFLALTIGAVRVLFDDGVPVEVASALTPILEKWAWLIPSICHEIVVQFNASPGDDGDVMAVALSPEYRRAELMVCPRWLKETKRERERCALHELCHIVVAPLTEFTHSVLERADKATREVLHEQHRLLYEGVVVDLTQSLFESRTRRRKS